MHTVQVCSLLATILFVIFVGAQFGTVISMPLSGLLSVSSGGWPSIFYVFGAIGTVWCIAFLLVVKEDPSANKRMNPEERNYIQTALGAKEGIPVSRLLGFKLNTADY